jgi:hypothetical protein
MKSLWLAVVAPMVLAGAAPSPRPEPAAAPPALPQFSDVAAAAGIAFQHSWGDLDLSNIVEGTGSGACAFDYDGDGKLDLYLPNGRWTKGVNDNRGRSLDGILQNALYRNEGDWTFTDVTAKAGVAAKGYGVGCSAADYDADGDLDLYVLNYGSNELFRNKGDGTFEDVSAASGLADPLFSVNAVWFDYDRDGQLDVYVANYLEYDAGKFRSFYAAAGYPGPLSYNGTPSALYRNNGDGTFSNVTRDAGLWKPGGRAMSAVGADLNDDGVLDLYVTNDAMESYYFEAKGDGTFKERGLLLGLAFGENGQGVSSMGPVVGDLRGLGLLDIFVPSMHYGSLLSRKGDFYVDRQSESGLSVICGQYVGWGGVIFDFDNDGALDLFMSTGDAHHLYSEHPVLARNDGSGRFLDVSDRAGAYFQKKWVARGATWGDFDSDGNVDLVVVDLEGAPHLLRNLGGGPHHWLKLDLRGRDGRTAIGARVKVTAGGRTQMQDVLPVNGYLSQGDPRLHFGLGAEKEAEKVEIRWPDRTTQVLSEVAADQVLKVVQEKR